MTLGRWWHPPSAGPYHDAMTAQPAEHPEDSLDPQRILRELPGRERANFLAAYRDETPTGFVDTIRSGTMVYEERTGSGTGSQEVHPGV